MSGTPFFEREGKPYCKADFEKLFAAKCEGCKNPISENAVIALEAKWHKDCFKCKVTSLPEQNNYNYKYLIKLKINELERAYKNGIT